MRRTRSKTLYALLACWTFACASRSVPSSEPRTSPASLEAPEGPPHVVTQALSEDPPLPGPGSERWSGLKGPSVPGGHEHHSPTEAAPTHQHGAAPAPQPNPAPSAPGRNEGTPESVRYVCPMHPDVVSAEPGRCPRCGMPLVKRP